MGEACSMYGARRETYRVLVGVNLRERDHLEDTGVDWRIILKWILESGMLAHGLDCSGSV